MPHVFLGNFDQFFDGPPTRKDAHKIFRLGDRITHNTVEVAGFDPDSVGILPSQPSREYLSYLQHQLYRCGSSLPRFVAPTTVDPNRLCLAKALLEDKALMRELKRKKGWVVHGLISSPDLTEVAEALGGTVAPMTDRAMRAGIAMRIRSKGWFKAICSRKDINIRTPEGVCVDSIGNAAHVCLNRLERDIDLMLRIDISAGGLGNLEFLRSLFDGELSFRTVLATLQHKSPESWAGKLIHVETNHETVHDLASVYYVDDEGPKFQCLVDRKVKKGESGGAIWPSTCPEPQAQEIRQASDRFMQLLWNIGYRGWADIDWAILKDGSIMAFECNARWLATNALLSMLNRHELNMSQLAGESIDYLKLPHHVDQAQFSAFMLRGNQPTNRRMWTQAEIMIPAQNGSASLVILGQDADSIDLRKRQIYSWCREGSSPKKPRAAL